MQGNRNRDTAPELAVRALVHRAGLRYRVAARPLAHVRWTADLVFRPALVAVFVDGCYWHGCPDHGHVPATNTSYWSGKLARNAERDEEFDEVLVGAGWLPLRFWEHEGADAIALAVIATVSERRPVAPLKERT
jgi:DNA mismatch endonuclease (patch repair protein)